MIQELAFTSTPKCRQDYLTVTVQQATRDEYKLFANEILKLRMTDNKNQHLWVEEVERKGSSFQIRIQMNRLVPSGMEQDKLLEEFRAKVGQIADRRLLTILSVKDGAF